MGSAYNWDPENNRISSETNFFKDIVNIYQLKHLMKGHTRITDSSAILIDLAFTNKPESNVTFCTRWNQ